MLDLTLLGVGIRFPQRKNDLFSISARGLQSEVSSRVRIVYCKKAGLPTCGRPALLYLSAAIRRRGASGSATRGRSAGSALTSSARSSASGTATAGSSLPSGTALSATVKTPLTSRSARPSLTSTARTSRSSEAARHCHIHADVVCSERSFAVRPPCSDDFIAHFQARKSRLTDASHFRVGSEFQNDRNRVADFDH